MTHPAPGDSLPQSVRLAHILPEVDGTVSAPTWLEGLDVQRKAALVQAASLVRPRARELRRGLPLLGRGTRIAWAGWRHGAEDAAPRLRSMFESRGPTFLKLGQIISGGGGLFPQALIDAFVDFRDALPPEPWTHVQRVLEEELPGGASRFASIDREPLAAASIAQVHAARLLDGREVVIKVQRPRVAAQVEADLALLAALAHSADRFLRPARTANLPGIVSYLAETLLQELDFRLEAENMLDVGAALSSETAAGGVIAPRPHPHFVTKRLLVMERFHGISSGDVEAVKNSGIDIERLLRSGFMSFLEGALVHGVFHGDLHPGNVLVLPDGRYGILDFGIVGRISKPERIAFARMLEAGFRDDHRAQLEAMRDMGAFPPDADLDELERDIDADAIPVGSKLPTMQTVAITIRSNLRMMMRHHFRLPTLLVLLSKNLLFANDTLQRYAPDMDLLGDAGPFILQTLMTMDSD